MRRNAILSGIILGFGMGGFLDGIVLHQLLQWHHFVSNVYPTNTVDGLELNTLWDGIFHSATYVITAIGLVLLWRTINRAATKQSPRSIWGGVFIGVGIFHIFDSIMNHWILRIHHIREGQDELAYDIGFFVIGLVLLGIGYVVLWAQRAFPAQS
jgi:uncharacterized membrane protein